MTAAVPVRPDPRNCRPLVQMVLLAYPREAKPNLAPNAVARGKRGYWLIVWHLYDVVGHRIVSWQWGTLALSPN